MNPEEWQGLGLVWYPLAVELYPLVTVRAVKAEFHLFSEYLVVLWAPYMPK